MKMIQVMWHKSHPQFSYFAGMTGEVDEKHIEMLTSGGYVQVISGDPVGDENPLPEDLPERDLLHENGFTEEKIKVATIEVLSEIKGIGKVTAEKVIAYYAPKE